MEELGVTTDIRHHPNWICVESIVLINIAQVNLELAAPHLVDNLQKLMRGQPLTDCAGMYSVQTYQTALRHSAVFVSMIEVRVTIGYDFLISSGKLIALSSPS